MLPLLVIWLIIAGVMLTIDVITSNFFFVCFSFGALVAILSGQLDLGPAGQIVAFLASSAVFLSFGYPLVKRLIRKTVAKTLTMEERLLGSSFEMSEDLKAGAEAKVKIQGVYWTVRNDGTDPIDAGESARIERIEGNKMMIWRN